MILEHTLKTDGVRALLENERKSMRPYDETMRKFKKWTAASTPAYKDKDLKSMAKQMFIK